MLDGTLNVNVFSISSASSIFNPVKYSSRLSSELIISIATLSSSLLPVFSTNVFKETLPPQDILDGLSVVLTMLISWLFLSILIVIV